MTRRIHEAARVRGLALAGRVGAPGASPVTRRVRELALAALMAATMFAASGVALAQSGGGYNLTSYTIDGGGIMWTNGNGYKVGGTVGQPDAGVLVGGSYTVKGGFWPMGAACPASSAAQAERLALPGSPISKKIRYLSFTAGDAGATQAIRVSFQNVPAPYAHWNGTQLWVQEPKRYCENAGQKTVPSPTSPPNYGCGSSGGISPVWFWGADLGCDAYFGDWTTYGVVHVWNQGFIPLGVYNVQVLDSTCSPDIEASYSTALTLTQSRWADLIKDCTTNPCGPPDNSTGIVDVTAILDKWKNLPGNVIKARADIEGSPAGDHRLPDQAVNITDVTYCLGAFLGQTYPPPGFPAPGNPPACP